MTPRNGERLTYAARASGEVELIDSYAQFTALRDQWHALYAHDASASHFLSWQWLLDLYRRRDHTVCILAWRAAPNAHYTAFLPLRQRIRRQSGQARLYNALSMAGNDWADHTGLLCDPANEALAVPALARALQTLPWGKLQFDSMRISTRRLSLLGEAFDPASYRVRERNLTDNGGRTDLNVSPTIALPSSWEAYLARLSANTRQKIRRYRRRVSRDPSLTFAWSTPATRQRDLGTFRRYWLARWAGVKGRQADTLADKYVKILGDGMRAGSLSMPLLLAGDIPVALLACYVDRMKRNVLYFVGARDLSFRAVPGGLLLHARLIEWAIGEGFTHYELLRGNEAYKYSLGAEDQRLYSLSISRRTLPVAAQLLDAACRSEALALVDAASRGGRRRTADRLYAQLLESWPGNPSVLDAYATFLDHSGQQLPASAIRDAIGADQSLRSASINACLRIDERP